MSDGVESESNIPTAVGPFPAVLYRVFDSKEFAKDFVEQGRFRMGIIGHYRTVEDEARRDTEEGEGSLSVPGPVLQVRLGKDFEVLGVHEVPGRVHLVSSICNATYLLCCSAPIDESGFSPADKFGQYAIRINDPEQLCQDITDYLYAGPSELAAVAVCVRVRYDKHAEVDAPQDNLAHFDLALAQKPASFADECEVRIAVTTGVIAHTANPFLHINLGRRLPYVDLLESGGSS